MAPRRRPGAGAAAPAALDLSSLPDDLLLRCLQPLSQEERCAEQEASSFRSVALVSKRFQQLCLAPQLLRRLDVSIIGPSAAVLPRTAALLQFSMAHAAHVQELDLDVDPAGVQSDSQQQELAALVASTLAAFGAAGSLQRLTISEQTPLVSTAWLPALRQLEYLCVGSVERPLRLPAAVSRLTALNGAGLVGSPLVLEGPLPPSLTRLFIEDHSTELPHQVSQLPALTKLQLQDVKYTSASMACLSTLTTLRRLECMTTHSLPAALPAMTWLECLHCGLDDAASAEAGQAWYGVLRVALPRLTRLTTLLLNPACEPDLSAVAQLPRLQRLWLGFNALPDPAMISGPWLASLRWLGLPWRLIGPSVGALRAAPHLEYVCSFGMPTRTDRARWRAAWDFLATHPPLRHLCIEIVGEGTPTMPFVDALIKLHNRRPALTVRRTTFASASGFHNQLLEDPEISPLPY